MLGIRLGSAPRRVLRQPRDRWRRPELSRSWYAVPGEDTPQLSRPGASQSDLFGLQPNDQSSDRRSLAKSARGRRRPSAWAPCWGHAHVAEAHGWVIPDSGEKLLTANTMSPLCRGSVPTPSRGCPFVRAIRSNRRHPYACRARLVVGLRQLRHWPRSACGLGVGSGLRKGSAQTAGTH